MVVRVVALVSAARAVALRGVGGAGCSSDPPALSPLILASAVLNAASAFVRARWPAAATAASSAPAFRAAFRAACALSFHRSFSFLSASL